jgi:hypothetical protein
MRLTGLLVLLLLILILFFAAPAASYAQTATNNTVKTSGKADAAQQVDQTFADLARRARSGSELERDGVCYTMRTYVMAREDKDSDVTRMVRATRCLPAWKLEFKTAVGTVHRTEDDSPAKR